MNHPLRVFQALRPRQWTKNAVVAAATVFAIGDRSIHFPLSRLGDTVLAVALFCLCSSAIYLINDVQDYERDRIHPRKKFRPIAAGTVSKSVALTLAACLAAACLATAWVLLTKAFTLTLLAYLVMQVGYTLGLKHLTMVDVLLIAMGFVLRALGGAYAVSVPISHWLLICTFLLALFLALSKRRHEKVVLASLENESRPSLKGYSEEWLDRLILLVCGSTITAYTLYTISEDAINKIGDQRLAVTLPFVLFGIGRYWFLVYRQERGERPEKVLFSDVPTLVNLLLYAGCLAILFSM